MGLNNQTTVTAELGKELYCQHCTYIWTYRGRSIFHTACPHCGFRVRVHLGEARAKAFRNGMVERAE
ncbi:hypothetical protein NTE_01776 [Candidatus Nitrososphaera evergladensis SR1]|uniref:Uncharacterized protein n=1 Tax=Candidatus Nitrososphaera evergladensis SR1 TaxID=1459636 RepID=A0A075MSS8_9ARCH|nr:hypothetical protein NTE_01776 [Candidatus Nitrososphaera evergladensis SR1]